MHRGHRCTTHSVTPKAPPYLVFLMLLQQLAAVTEKLLQAQLRLPALPYALGEVCHQAAGTGEPSLGLPLHRAAPPPGAGARQFPALGLSFPICSTDLTLSRPTPRPTGRLVHKMPRTKPGLQPLRTRELPPAPMAALFCHLFQTLICRSRERRGRQGVGSERLCLCPGCRVSPRTCEEKGMLREGQHNDFCPLLGKAPESRILEERRLRGWSPAVSVERWGCRPQALPPRRPSIPAQGSKHMLVEGAVFCPDQGHQLLDHPHGAQGAWGKGLGGQRGSPHPSPRHSPPPPSFGDRPWAPCPGRPTFVFGVAHQQVLQQERRLDLEFLHLLLHGTHQDREAIQAKELQQPSLLFPDQAWVAVG